MDVLKVELQNDSKILKSHNLSLLQTPVSEVLSLIETFDFPLNPIPLLPLLGSTHMPPIPFPTVIQVKYYLIPKPLQ